MGEGENSTFLQQKERNYHCVFINVLKKVKLEINLSMRIYKNFNHIKNLLKACLRNN